MNHISIIGGGIGGLCTAIALRKIGLQPQVYERVSTLKGVGAGLMLAPNAIKALRAMGLEEAVLAVAQPMDQLQVLDQRGRLLANSDIAAGVRRYGARTYAIHRADLHQLLLDQLPSESIHLGHSALFIGQEENVVRIRWEDGSVTESEFVIGADGIHSPVRQSVLPDWPERYSGYTCWRGIANARGLAANWHQASETWGSKGRFGIFPLRQARIYWFATTNAPQNSPEMASWGIPELQAHFADYHSQVQQVLAHTAADQLLWNDIADLPPLPQLALGRTLLLGDAGHATTPNMGQGACMAIEDAVVLADCLQQQVDERTAFQAFERLRLPRTRHIVQQSWRIGQLGQWTHPLAIRLRNALLRLTPSRINERQLDRVYGVEFPVLGNRNPSGFPVIN